MNDSSFAEQVSEALQRVTKLRLRAQRASGGEVAEVMAEALEELGVVCEELQVAQEELRVRNEAAAAAERNRFRDLFEFAPNGYVVTDAEGVVHQANRAACELLGLTPRYLVHKPLTVFVAPEDRTAFLGQLSGLQRGEPVWEQTVRFQPRAEGAEPRVVDLTVVPFRDPETRRPMFRWQMRDVTEQWQATEAAAPVRAVRPGGPLGRPRPGGLGDRAAPGQAADRVAQRVSVGPQRRAGQGERVRRPSAGDRGTGRARVVLMPREGTAGKHVPSHQAADSNRGMSKVLLRVVPRNTPPRPATRCWPPGGHPTGPAGGSSNNS